MVRQASHGEWRMLLNESISRLPHRGALLSSYIHLQITSLASFALVHSSHLDFSLALVVGIEVSASDGRPDIIARHSVGENGVEGQRLEHASIHPVMM